MRDLQMSSEIDGVMRSPAVAGYVRDPGRTGCVRRKVHY